MTDSTEKKTIVRTLSGTVVSVAGDKTAVVAVHTMKTHKKYRKRFGSTTRYKVHDPENTAKLGETVTFKACRPVSKHKRWMLVPDETA
ncbi:MAG: 30S ribosomal protein S17 [Candidatus Doudnabacteria bacterium]|nr:30S ribosomal protein S17 [Candidatus Doudnabacteria bacterium]